MPRISLDQVNSLPDLLSAENFELLLGNIPGGPSKSEQLAIKCLNANLPGSGNEAFEAPIHGHVVKFRGRKTMPRTLSITYVEDSQFNTLNSLHRWNEFVVGTLSGTSAGDKKDYAVDGQLTVFNHKGEAISVYKIFKLFPVDLPDIQLSGENTTMVQVPITFSYDYWTASGVTAR